jgi:hypothetical protein
MSAIAIYHQLTIPVNLTTHPILQCVEANGTDTVVWIGVVGVVPRDGCELLEPEEGAYVNFLTLAASDSEHRAKVIGALSYYRRFSVAFNRILARSKRPPQRSPKHIAASTPTMSARVTQISVSTSSFDLMPPSIRAAYAPGPRSRKHTSTNGANMIASVTSPMTCHHRLTCVLQFPGPAEFFDQLFACLGYIVS